MNPTYDTPPSVLMFGVTAKAGPSKGTNLSEVLSSVAEGLMCVWGNPSVLVLFLLNLWSKRLSCATIIDHNNYIQQLKELHQLLEVSVISQNEHMSSKIDIIFKKMKLP